MSDIYDLWVIVLPLAVVVFASYAALNLARRLIVTRGRARKAWLVGGALAMGVGVWSTHFFGMLAFSVSRPVLYDVPTLLVSVSVAIIASGIALLVAVQATQLEENEQRYESLFKHNPDAVYSLDLDGNFLAANPACEKLTGYKVEELLRMSLTSFVAREDLKKVSRHFERAIKGEPQNYEIAFTHKDDHRVEASVTYVPIIVDHKIVGVYGIAKDVTERKQSEEEIRRLNQTLEKRVAERTAQLADRESQLEDLVGKLIMAQEEERRRVAYEVHDGLTQVAIAAYRYLQAFADDHPPGSEVRPGELNRPLELTRRTIKEARRVVKGLRPTALDDFGLATAVRLRVEELQNEGWQIGYEEALGGERLPAEIETALYRVTQEALANVQKHAQSTEAHVTLRRHDRKVYLEVRDEGRGFDPSAVPESDGPVERVGLSSMRERVALLGGELKIVSKPGAGTSLVAEVPLPASKVDGYHP